MERKEKPVHITEFSDLPPRPEAVLGRDGHIKSSFIDKFANENEKGHIPYEQKMKILGHNSDCAQCSEAIRKAKGELPPGSLPFEK